MRAGPTLLFARIELQNRWLSLLGLSLLIAFAGAFVLTAATGARRAATAWDRFEEVTRAPNLVATPPPPVTTIAIAVATLIGAVLGAFAIAINARRAPLAASLRTEIR